MANGTWSRFYEIILDDTPSVARGEAVSSSQNGASYTGSNPVTSPATRCNNSVIRISGSNIWRITWQVPVANSGQLALGYTTSGGGSPILLLDSVVGTSWGHCQIVGDYLVSVPYATSYYIGIYNP